MKILWGSPLDLSRKFLTCHLINIVNNLTCDFFFLKVPVCFFVFLIIFESPNYFRLTYILYFFFLLCSLLLYFFYISLSLPVFISWVDYFIIMIYKESKYHFFNKIKIFFNREKNIQNIIKWYIFENSPNFKMKEL